MNRNLEQEISEIYLANLDIIGEGLPAEVNAARPGHLETFNLLSLPDTKDERYRHSDIRKLFEGGWEQYFTPTGCRGIEPLPLGGMYVTILNGFTGEPAPLQLTDNGIVYGSLKAAMSYMWETIKPYYNSVADNNSNALTALNSLMMQDGAFIYLPEGIEADGRFVLDFRYMSEEQAQLCLSRTLIIASAGSRAEVVVAHTAVGDTRFIVDSVTEIITEAGARLSVSEVRDLGPHSAVIASSYIKQAERSRLDQLMMWAEADHNRSEITIDLDGAECESNLHGIYFATESQKADINIRMNHNRPDCDSFQLVKGVTSGDAVGSFTGRVYVERNAQRTAALQQSRNLQLSETSRIYAEPQLEIYADDVKCSHGATVGQLDDDAVYYMRQRGLSEKDAKRLQLAGFVNDIIHKCPDEEVCRFFEDIASRRINQL